MVLDPSSALQSLNAGRIDAASLVSPFTAKAEAEGNRLLAKPGLEFFRQGAIGLWVAGKGTVSKQSVAEWLFRRSLTIWID